METANIKKKLSLFILLSCLFSISASILIAGYAVIPELYAAGMMPQDSITIRNEAYKFEVTFPGKWTYKKVVQSDPDEGLRNGEASFSISGGGNEKEPENWNGIVFNSAGSYDDPHPFVSISAHKKADQKPEEFAELFESAVAGYGGKIININREFKVRGAKGMDYNYSLFIPNRYVVLYQDSIRVIIHYFFPASDTTLFEKHAQEVDYVIKSLQIN